MVDEEMMEVDASLPPICDHKMMAMMSVEKKSQALLVASRRGKADLIHLLLQAGARPNVEDELRCTPLMFVAAQGLTGCLKAMIETPGCTIHKRNESQQTALHFAAEKGQASCVKCLVQNRAMVNLADDWGMTPLMLAVNSGSVDCVAILLNNGARLEMIDLRGYSALVHASRGGYTEIVGMLIKHGSSVNLVGKTSPLHQASTFGHVECVQLLLEAGARASVRDIHYLLPLQLATKTDQLGVVSHLLENTQQSEDDINGALSTAARSNAFHCLEVLLNHGANPDQAQQMPTLLMAVDQNNIESVVLLIKHQCDINRYLYKTSLYNTDLRDLSITFKGDRITALMIAILRGYSRLVEILLKAGAKTGPLSHLLMYNQVPDVILHDEQLMLWLLDRASGPLTLMEYSREKIRQVMVLCNSRGSVDLLPLPYPLKCYMSHSQLPV